MLTLFMDRSTDCQSLAIDENGTLISRVLADLDCRSGEWTSAVESFLGGRHPDRIVVGTGPGSFAGIRAALAFAQGYAIGSGCEVLGLPSPCALADGSPLAVVGDARRGKAWIALFDGYSLVRDVFQVDFEVFSGTVPNQASNSVGPVPSDWPVVTPDEKRIGTKLSSLFGARYRGGGIPTAEGLARFAAACPEILRKEPLPLYLNPAVREN